MVQYIQDDAKYVGDICRWLIPDGNGEGFWTKVFEAYFLCYK